MPIAHSVGTGGKNLPADVKLVQQLLNRQALSASLAESGVCDPATLAAILAFQKTVVKQAVPDGRIDPGGKTDQTLNKPAPATGVCAMPDAYTVTVVTTKTAPPSKTGGKVTTPHLYEATVTVVGPTGGNFRGSVWPDDMSEKGRIKDGVYPLHLGFHKRDNGAHAAPTVADLEARTQGFRACLVVNLDADVPVTSDDAAKTTSAAIHVHNGFNSQRFSDGCPTLAPADWSRFIGLFLSAYPLLTDWTATNKFVGVKAGRLVVQSA